MDGNLWFVLGALILGLLIMIGVVFIFLRKYDFQEYCFDQDLALRKETLKAEKDRFEEGLKRDADALTLTTALKTRVESLETKISFAMQELSKGRRI